MVRQGGSNDGRQWARRHPGVGEGEVGAALWAAARRRRGAPLFALDATEFVQAANTLITALGALKTARSQLTQAEINEKRAHELYLAKGGALKDWQQSQTDLASAQNGLRSADIALAAARNALRILGKSDAGIAALEASPTHK